MLAWDRERVTPLKRMVVHIVEIPHLKHPDLDVPKEPSKLSTVKNLTSKTIIRME